MCYVIFVYCCVVMLNTSSSKASSFLPFFFCVCVCVGGGGDTQRIHKANSASIQLQSCAQKIESPMNYHWLWLSIVILNRLRVMLTLHSEIDGLKVSGTIMLMSPECVSTPRFIDQDPWSICCWCVWPALSWYTYSSQHYYGWPATSSIVE